MKLKLNGESMHAFIASSPDDFCTKNRTPDLDSVLSAINNAESYAHRSETPRLPAALRSAVLCVAARSASLSWTTCPSRCT